MSKLNAVQGGKPSRRSESAARQFCHARVAEALEAARRFAWRLMLFYPADVLPGQGWRRIFVQANLCGRLDPGPSRGAFYPRLVGNLALPRTRRAGAPSWW